MVELKPVTSLSELKRFIDFPRKLYAGNPYYVPDLRMDELNTLRADINPAFAFCDTAFFMAYQDGRPVGRVGLIINERANETWKERRARFTRLDFIDDPEVSAALLGRAEQWARERAMEALHGPLGFTDMDQEGMLVEGFEELSTLATIYNGPYYPRHLERLGYRKDTDWMEFQFQVPDKPDARLSQLADSIIKRYGFKLLNFTKASQILPYGKELFALINEGYKGLYGYTQLDERQVESYIKQYFGVVNPAFIKIVLDAEGRMAGFGIAMPSMSRALQRCGGRMFPLGWAYLLRAIRKNDRLDLYLVAVRPELQNRGINAIIIDAVTREAIAHGIRIVESNPELEDNVKVQSQWKFFERRQHRRRRCYIKSLEEPGEKG